MPLVFQPDTTTFFLRDHASPHPAFEPFARRGRPTDATLVLPTGVRAVPGRSLPFAATILDLAVLPARDLPALPPTLATWALASRLALELVARERLVPGLQRTDHGVRATWLAALSAPADAARVAALGRSMPPAAHAVPLPGGHARDVWAPDMLLRHFLDAAVDAFARYVPEAPASDAPAGDAPGPRPATPGTAVPTRPAVRMAHRPVRDVVQGMAAPWPRRWLAALTGPDRRFEPDGLMARRIVDDLAAWSASAVGVHGRLRACFRLDVPDALPGEEPGLGTRVLQEESGADDRRPFRLQYLLQSPDDPSLLVPAADVWQTKGRRLERFGTAFRDPQESLLEALGRASRLFPPIAASLREVAPAGIDLDPSTAWSFLTEGAASLADAGLGVIVPAEFTAAGRRRLRLRMRVGHTTGVAGAVEGASGLGLDDLVDFSWEAAIGDTAITARELAAIARQKAPLVRHRGMWVAVDPDELKAIRAHLSAGGGRVTLRQGMQVALAGETRQENLSVTVQAVGVLADMLDRLRGNVGVTLAPPDTLQATLRPYQARGFTWLSTLASLGLGACLADDMGLGKTIQVLTLLLERRQASPGDMRPMLVVAPTSVVGNWQREVERFAPSLEVRHHYGADRARTVAQLPRTASALVITTYGMLRRDAALLSRMDWAAVVLDEAQNIKNAASATARAARGLRASQRVALTGTPVENRLAELWSILEFANPGLLGPLETFTRQYAVPIERHGDDVAAERLRRVTGPFVLRRLKSDKSIIDDLPAKHVMQVLCTLTREQATLYQAVVDEALRGIEAAEGMERRGRVLTLLMHLKQICNHPAQYLGESGPLAGRSGKLARVGDMLDEAVAAGDKALVFTQFREMGNRLASYLGGRLRTEVLFLHGGTPRSARESMVRRFQEEVAGPRIFVLSLKAGGTGLNLTAATHVFHYDRWWNPAVEDQATDRAYRIGQTRGVQVHALVCAGTVEEKIAHMLERKRELAVRAVGTGEQWITELGNGELRELFALAGDAVVDPDGDPDDFDTADVADRRNAGGGGEPGAAADPLQQTPRRAPRLVRTRPAKGQR